MTVYWSWKASMRGRIDVTDPTYDPAVREDFSQLAVSGLAHKKASAWCKGLRFSARGDKPASYRSMQGLGGASGRPPQSLHPLLVAP